MKGQGKWVSEEANQAILQGIREEIRRSIAAAHGSALAAEASDAIARGSAEIEEAHAAWIVDEPSRFHLRFMALLLAGYRRLVGLMTGKEALAVLKTAAIAPSRASIAKGVAYALDGAADPMGEIVAASKEREEHFFGRTFSFERNQDDQKAYILHVKRCFYQQFAAANNAPELMEVLCEWDWIWADSIQPARHRFSFELPTTLGLGGDMCRFCFRRLSE